jgi:hypothetical protein
MTASHPDLLISSRAFMAPAPLQARIPRPASDEDEATFLVLEDIARLHLAAFVTRHGPPPQAVGHQIVRTGCVGALRPRIMLSISGPRSPKASAWIDAAVAGLDTWQQAGWTNPIVTERIGDQVMWWTAPLEEAALEAAARLKRRGDVQSLTNLSDHLEGGLPPHLDPENPAFGWRYRKAA